MKTINQKAFTLLELLVVIAIIGVLSAVLLTQYSQIREHGWSTRCKANLRTLYQGALNFSVANGGGYPNAGSLEVDTVQSDGSHVYSENPNGWVNWVGPGVWPNTSPQYSGMSTPWNGNGARDSIKKGALWEYTLKDKSIYFCPKFRSLKPGADVARSYVMNSKFGYYYDCTCTQTNINFGAVSGDEASRTLLFADMAANKYYGKTTMSVANAYAGSGGQGEDGALNAGGPPGGTPPITQPVESIGYIHVMSGGYYGHAVFLDGHIEAIGLKQNSGSYSNRTYDACIGKF